MEVAGGILGEEGGGGRSYTYLTGIWGIGKISGETGGGGGVREGSLESGDSN